MTTPDTMFGPENTAARVAVAGNLADVLQIMKDREVNSTPDITRSVKDRLTLVNFYRALTMLLLTANALIGDKISAQSNRLLPDPGAGPGPITPTPESPLSTASTTPETFDQKIKEQLQLLGEIIEAAQINDQNIFGGAQKAFLGVPQDTHNPDINANNSSKGDNQGPENERASVGIPLPNSSDQNSEAAPTANPEVAVQQSNEMYTFAQSTLTEADSPYLYKEFSAQPAGEFTYSIQVTPGADVNALTFADETGNPIALADLLPNANSSIYMQLGSLLGDLVRTYNVNKTPQDIYFLVKKAEDGTLTVSSVLLLINPFTFDFANQPQDLVPGSIISPDNKTFEPLSGVDPADLPAGFELKDANRVSVRFMSDDLRAALSHYPDLKGLIEAENGATIILGTAVVSVPGQPDREIIQTVYLKNEAHLAGKSELEPTLRVTPKGSNFNVRSGPGENFPVTTSITENTTDLPTPVPSSTNPDVIIAKLSQIIGATNPNFDISQYTPVLEPQKRFYQIPVPGDTSGRAWIPVVLGSSQDIQFVANWAIKVEEQDADINAIFNELGLPLISSGRPVEGERVINEAGAPSRPVESVLLSADLSPSEVSIYNNIISKYPGGNETRLLAEAQSQNIMVIGWNKEFLAVEGTNSSGEKVYFFPNMGDQGLLTGDKASREQDDFTNGWTRYGGSMTASDGTTVNLFTTLKFTYNNQNYYLSVNPETKNNQNDVDKFFREVCEADPRIKPDGMIDLIANGREIYNMIGTLNSPDLIYRVNNLGYQAAAPQDFAGRKYDVDDNHAIITVSMNETNLRGDTYSPDALAWHIFLQGIGMTFVDEEDDLRTAVNKTNNDLVTQATVSLYNALGKQNFVNLYPVKAD